MTRTPGHILSVAVPRPLDGLFTYFVPDGLLPKIRVGGWVKVPFGKKATTHAFVVEPPRPVSEVPAGLSLDSIKEILAVGDEGAIFPDDVLALCRWTHEYYRSPLGEVLNCAAPPAALGLKNSRNLRVSGSSPATKPSNFSVGRGTVPPMIAATGYPEIVSVVGSICAGTNLGKSTK